MSQTYTPAQMASEIANLGQIALQAKSVSPSTSQQIVEPDSGKAGLSSVTVAAISPVKTAEDLTASGATVTAPAGWYASAASKSVSSGTEGTPTASKGAVSNHSVTVTPSVTNTAGYISGGAHSGIPVTVTAAELESGTKQIDANGSGIDVSGYAAVDVAVHGGDYQSVRNESAAATPADIPGAFWTAIADAFTGNPFYGFVKGEFSGSNIRICAQFFVDNGVVYCAIGSMNTTMGAMGLLYGVPGQNGASAYSAFLYDVSSGTLTDITSSFSQLFTNIYIGAYIPV